jgi:hypothetical protein
MDWQNSVAGVVGVALLGNGVIWALAWLLASSYLGKKMENVATKQDVGAITRAVEEVKNEFQSARDAQTHLYELALKSVDFEHQLRLAALGRQLEVHQAAYAQWWNLRGKMHGSPEDAQNAAFACQKFWVENHLYLTPDARQAFRDAFIAVATLVQLRSEPKDQEGLREWKECSAAVLKVGDVITTAMKLPPLQIELPGRGTSAQGA